MSTDENDAGPPPHWGETKLEVVQDDDPRNSTFTYANEDHTLGNAVRYAAMQNPEVIFCGYSVPHPSENRMNVRIQSARRPAMEVFHDALQYVHDMTDHMQSVFKQQVQAFRLGTSTSADSDAMED